MDTTTLQAKMREAFRVEAADLLAELDSSMLELETRPQDVDLLNRVFRAIHTIKGSGATAGFKEMAAFTHHVEELFDEARMGRLTIAPEMIDLGLRAKDLIGQLMEAEDPASLAPSCNELIKLLAHFLPHKSGSAVGGSSVSPEAASQVTRYTILFKPHSNVFFSGTDPVNLVEELCTLGEAQVTARLDGIPPLDTLNPEQCYLSWRIELTSAKPLAKIKEVFLFVEDESDIQIQSEPASPGPVPAVPYDAFRAVADQSLEAIAGFLKRFRAVPESFPEVSDNYLRMLTTLGAIARDSQHQGVDTVLEEQVQLLESARSSGQAALPDQSLNRLTELHATLASLIQSVRPRACPAPEAASVAEIQAEAAPRNPSVSGSIHAKQEAPQASATIRVDQEKLDRLMQAVGELLVARNALPILARKVSSVSGQGSLSKEVKDAGSRISRIADDLQAAVMSIRMMPIRTVFQRFPRLARDICRTQEKEASLILEGEDTELDKTVVEQIGDPLVHLVRNALDHGIESPEAREQAGKPRSGTVRLKAYNKGNNVVIEVHDDGRGMDGNRIKMKAVEKGLISAEDAATLSESAALELIFLPGLSTAEKVTDISGRGVGMDVVRSNIQKLQGTTTLESWPGRGSKLTITLPTSLMVSKGILVESNGEEYVLPMETVSEMVRLPRGQIHSHEQQYFASVRNRVFSVVRLADYFGSEQQRVRSDWPTEVSMAIVQTEQMQVGLVVDRFVSDVEVIVKPMGRDLANNRAFRGATIMGDGRVVLVINPSGFM